MIRNSFFAAIWKRITGLRQDCQGFVVMSTLAIFLFLFVLCASIYAVGETIHQRIKIQNACDAAAYSAAVVQADGLSRMAVVNRAMAWSYVQMTNRQMDYITYRWLKLTCKRFQEDKENAKNYNEQLILAVDKELGLWALLEAAVTAGLSALADYDCAGKNGGNVSDVLHREEGRGYWCGLEDNGLPIPRKEHRVHLNVAKNTDDSFVGQIVDGVGSYISESIFNIDNISKAVNALGKVIDTGDGTKAEEWGHWLGKLIDYDKENIYCMNRALERINTQMEISMKMTAENVLKAMLKDNRYDSESVLKDYYISIHIPHAENPYDTQKGKDSHFSPLHNTEADEMLFLNMQSASKNEKSLPQHFPVLLGGNSPAYGLDQWFIRGKGNYSKTDNEEKEYAFYSVGKLEGISLTGTKRNEGALGIQRVYKDTNLNETGAGFFAKNRKKKVAEHPAGFAYGHKEWKRKPQCCRDAFYKYVNSKPHDYYFYKKHDIYETLPDEKHSIDRGNHLMDFTNITNAIVNGVSSYFGGNMNSSNSEGSFDSSTGVTNQGELTASLKEERAKYEEQLKNAQTEEEKKSIQDKIDSINASIADPVSALTGNLTGSSQSSKMPISKTDFSSAGNTILGGVSSVVGNMLGQYFDIQPSCGNNPQMAYQFYPMCQTIKKTTTALYSEYRWGSCKWYCLTSGWTYLITFAIDVTGFFGGGFLERTDDYGDWKIYCDYGSADIATLKLPWPLDDITISGKGWGHYGFPKWFCGAGPTCPIGTVTGNSFFDRLTNAVPPFVFKEISEAKHGYMDHPLHFTENEKGNSGFMKPIKPMWDKDCREFSRDEYRSCAMFPDGLGDVVPIRGLNAYPGLIRGHARIYADDKEIFDNRYVGAICKPWVLNERFFAGDGSIVVGAAMKHTNPFVQLFNFWNTKGNKTGTEEQEGNESTVLSAFNIPKGNFMWTMSAARAGVRHRRRNGAYDQERQYQITYDSTSDVENLNYSKKSGPYVKKSAENGWMPLEGWDGSNDNKHALSRIYFPTQTQSPIWNGCPCGQNSQKFKSMWNLCETDWDATLLPLRYAGQRAQLYLEKEEDEDHVNENDAFNSQNYSTRTALLGSHYEKIGNGKYWVWNNVATDKSAVLMSNPFINSRWKPANVLFFKNLLKNDISGIPAVFLLQNKIPTGKEEENIHAFFLLKDKLL